MKIGDKIRNLRLKNNLTQSELGNRCDLTKGFISQLESDLTSPSLSTLEDILRCLGTSFQEFFSDERTEKVVYKKEDVIVKDFGDLRVYWLVSDAQKNEMEPVMVELESGMSTDEEAPHEGEEFGYVLSGSITLVTGGHAYKIKKGESFYFQARTPHYIKNAGKVSAKLLWITSPPYFSFG
ncbi:MAG: helix-turn-helix transcriptional regulator [Clostridia bacterium]|nr:helix-turn-helix transcriptional regulator [Clostridia bacterium]